MTLGDGDTGRSAGLGDGPDGGRQPRVGPLVADPHRQRRTAQRIAGGAGIRLGELAGLGGAVALGDGVVGGRVQPRVGDRDPGVLRDRVTRRAQRDARRACGCASGPCGAKISCSMPADGESVRS